MKTSGALLSADRMYRYSLWRIWDESLPVVMFVGLNPSTADESKDDNTIRRCIGFAKDWGYGGLYMANLFAYRATKPKDMKATPEPVGNDNNSILVELYNKADITIAAWSADGNFKNRDKEVQLLLPKLHVLKINKDGSPGHPLYLKKSLTPMPWNFDA